MGKDICAHGVLMVKVRFSEWLKIKRIAIYRGDAPRYSTALDTVAIYPIAGDYAEEQCNNYCIHNKETVMLHLIAVYVGPNKPGIFFCRCYT